MSPGGLALIVLAALVAALAGVLFVARRRWEAASREAVRRLRAACQSAPDARAVAPAGAADLPACVRRYLARAVPPGAAAPRYARVWQQGDFRLGATWRPFEAEQVFTLRPPGFVWDARVRMAPGLHVRVRDGYTSGQGFMHAALLGALTVARAQGSPEMALGSLQRWLAETMWFPQALAHGHGVTWTPIDDHSARATLADGAVTTALEFHFTPDGDLVRVFTPERFREQGGRFATMPWGGRVLAWQEQQGVRFASEVEVGWFEDAGFAPFYRGRVTRVSYDDTAS